MSALSPRLQVVMALCQTLHTPDIVMADIGTDHAYLPIAAVQQGICRYAYACDLNPAPLAIADDNIRNAGLTGKIETRLGNGLTPLASDTVDCIVIAGMGGMRICSILHDEAKQAQAAKLLILQPQHDIVLLRKHLHNAGFKIKNEQLVRETVGGKYHFYVILAAQYTGIAEKWTEQEYFLGKYLMAECSNAFLEYKLHEKEKIAAYISQIRDEASIAEARQRMSWLT